MVALAFMFRAPNTAEFQTKPMSMFLDQLDSHILKLGAKWSECGAHIATSIIGSLLKFGCTDSRLRSHLAPKEKPSSRPPAPEPKRGEQHPDPDDLSEWHPETDAMPHEWLMLFETLQMVLKRVGDSNVLSFLHVIFVFCWRLSLSPGGADYLDRFLPFGLMCNYLNNLEPLGHSAPPVAQTSFPSPPQGSEQPLPEDFLLRGQVYSEGVFPLNWFENASSDIDERSIEQPHTSKRRTLRVKWLALRFAAARDTSSTLNKHSRNVAITNDSTVSTHRRRRQWIKWDPSTDKFSVVDIDADAKPTETLTTLKGVGSNTRIAPSTNSDSSETTKVRR